jgi:hypothetical protein
MRNPAKRRFQLQKPSQLFVRTQKLTTLHLGASIEYRSSLFLRRFRSSLGPDPQSQRANDAARLLGIAPRGAELIGYLLERVAIIRGDEPLRRGP